MKPDISLQDPSPTAWRCPSCNRLVAVVENLVPYDAPIFKCLKCGTRWKIDATEAETITTH